MNIYGVFRGKLINPKKREKEDGRTYFLAQAILQRVNGKLVWVIHSRSFIKHGCYFNDKYDHDDELFIRDLTDEESFMCLPIEISYRDGDI